MGDLKPVFTFETSGFYNLTKFYMMFFLLQIVISFEFQIINFIESKLINLENLGEKSKTVVSNWKLK